ncbi:carboxypeptidase-like regulatory domain-containing protein [Longitalea luteola]|uniref:carboxypeptidase-like regulatory domain-containing protein n=1 Tax=Longitalea luteola TaxID=2812563 RepID=UPI001A962E95|nr:carboxypeptidase-like regulatory domain-containing protein [Longitalea luteola]
MPASIHLNIPEPCHENWNNMTPREQGRFCGSCQKVVVDFSVMSDQEMLNYFSKASEHVCGRFSNDQLNKEIKPTEKKKRFKLVYLWSVMLASFIITKSYAQGKPRMKKPATESVRPNRTLGEVALVPDEPVKAVIPIVMNGTIVDAQNGKPVVAASITVEGTENGTMADSTGHFRLSVENKHNMKIVISAIGYETQTLMIENTTSWKNIQVLLKPQAVTLEEVSVIGNGSKTGRYVMGGAIGGIRITRIDTIKDSSMTGRLL